MRGSFSVFAVLFFIGLGFALDAHPFPKPICTVVLCAIASLLFAIMACAWRP